MPKNLRDAASARDEYMVLGALHRHGEMTIAKIEKETGFWFRVISDAVTRLLEKGEIDRRLVKGKAEYFLKVTMNV